MHSVQRTSPLQLKLLFNPSAASQCLHSSALVVVPLAHRLSTSPLVSEFSIMHTLEGAGAVVGEGAGAADAGAATYTSGLGMGIDSHIAHG